MTAEEAAEIADLIKPELAVPMHFGSVVGSSADALRFKEKCSVPVEILSQKDPFINDLEALGTWKSVDFIENIGDFKPGTKNFKGDLYLKEMLILENGKTGGPWNWTKGLILHPGDKTAAKYLIKEIAGSKYMFFEWKSGDYTIRHMKPSYYVLKKD